MFQRMIPMYCKIYTILNKYSSFLDNSTHENITYTHTGSNGGQTRSKVIDYRTIYHGSFNDGSV